jgi:F-type H+-transporting ATPase subunit gamma
MEMVAAAKLRKAQERLGAAGPYAKKLNEVLGLLASAGGDSAHPFFEVRGGKKEAVVLVTSDRGLCGAYNSNLTRATELYMNSVGPDNVKLIVIGRKGLQYFRHREIPIAEAFEGMGDQVDFQIVQRINRAAVTAFRTGEVDRVSIISTRYESVSRRSVERTEFLPIIPPEAVDGHGPTRDFIYEPSKQVIYDELIPRYAQAFFYSTLAEGFASEHAARMTAMGNATRNANELIDELILQRNRLRQAAITSELADIVGAVEAMA